MREEREGLTVADNGGFLLERESLLSKIPANPTVEILWSKKESRSTHQGLRVGSGFEEFRQTT